MPGEFRTRLATWLPWTLLLVYGVFALFVWPEPLWRPDWDSALYLLTAKSLAAGEGYRYLGEPFFLRPVGFPWLLSFFVGGDSLPALWIHRGLLLCALGVVVLLFVLLRRRCGEPAALAVALLTGTSPLFVRLFNSAMSDFPYLLAVCAALVLFQQGQRVESEGRRLAWWIAAGVLVAASVWLRTVGVILIPGILLLGFRSGRRRAALLAAGVALVLVLPWFAYARSAARAADSPSRQLLLHDYTTALLRRDPGDPSSPRLSLEDWGQRVAANAEALATELARTCHLAGSAPEGEAGEGTSQRLALPPTNGVALVVLAILAGAGFVLALRSGPSLFEWAALAHGFVLLTYFTHASRLCLPLVPAFVLYPILPLFSAARRGRPAWLRGLAATGVALLFATNLASLPGHLDASEAVRTRWEDVRATARWVAENTPRDAIVLAKQAPLVALLGGRTTYSYRFHDDPAMLDELGIDYAIFFGSGGARLMAEARRRGLETWQLGETSKPTTIYRLEHR